MAGHLAHEQRLLQYYRDCVAAEGRYDLTFHPASLSMALLTCGSEPAVTRSPGVRSLPQGQGRAERWIRTLITSSDPEPISVGYPVVVGRARRTAREGLVAALLVRECDVRIDGAGGLLFVNDDRPLELNPSALALVGLEQEERVSCLQAFASASNPSFSLVVHILERAGVRLAGLDADALRPLPSGPGVSNTAMLLTAARANATRAVVADLAALARASPKRLRSGPLGVLLGAVPAPAAPRAVPVPAVVPTNLSQDRAVTSAMVSTLTVVTGPPGTGKSQVLVNTIAAALTRGQTVLFASRTNRAVDVVFLRLAALRHPGLPLRAGRAALRGPAADCIRSALARPPGVGEEANPAATWATFAAGLMPLYLEAGYRDEVEHRLVTARAAADQLAAAWAWNLPDLGPPGADGEAASALLAVRRALSRRRGMRRRGQLGSSLRRLDAVLPPPGLGHWRGVEELADRLDGVAAAIGLSRHHARADALTAELERIPSALALDDSVAQLSHDRLEAGMGMWADGWSRRIRRARPAAQGSAALVADSFDGKGGHRPTPVAMRGCLELFPIWGVTNLAAGSCLPLASELFDLVVIDEASQCDVASALPLLARARRAMIIGDRHQLPHVSSLSADRERSIALRHHVGDGWEELSQRSRSLFDVASARVGHAPLMLDQHYRCHPDIIGFSNHRFYAGRLTVRTPDRPGGGIHWHDVPGTFARGPRGRGVRNTVEASAVIDCLAAEVAAAAPGTSFGVVTPFRAQAELLRELAEERLAAKLDMITIDTVHRFQGDERDVMVLSTTVSGAMPAFFVQVAGHPNLLNVAVTRARWRLVVVGDRHACLRAGGALAELADYVAGLAVEAPASPG